jgi:hypothetical protein
MLRRASLAGVLAASLGLAPACGAGRDPGPAWPKPHEREADGGESLAPRLPGVAAAIERAPDQTSSAPGRPAAAAAAAGVAGAAAAPAPRTDEPAAEAPAPKDPDVLMTEELIIEIED